MPRANEVTVLKFGSSVLRSEADLQTAVHEIYRWWREGQQVVAVVSAFGDTTDKLTQLAREVSDEPDDSALAALLATGEAASSALLGLSLNKSGIPARVFDAVQAGLRTRGSSLDADLTGVDVQLLRRELLHRVVVLPGFVGRGKDGNTTLLGRGGSDLTALFLAQRLNASCVLLKDVDGLYTTDPNSANRTASRFSHVSYQTAVRAGGSVVQPKAVRFAEKQRLRFNVTSVGATHSTEVGAATDQIAVSETLVEPLRVALLGCGTVGGGVYERLAALPQLFTVTGVGTRNVESAIAANVPVRLITTKLEALVEKSADVVVELIGGTALAGELVKRALGQGHAVVTANKALLAQDGVEFGALARANETLLRFSAAVGGGVPALEAAARASESGRVLGFSGVLNATSNFVLERMSHGETINEAVSVAQQLGYAEANPQLDLDGTDAAQKLILLARVALGIDLPFESIERKGIESVSPTLLQRAKERGRVLRFVAECRRSKNQVFSKVGPVELSLKHPLASVNGADNRLVLTLEGKQPLVVSGRGAGRYPTTEAVLADLFEIRRELQWKTIQERGVCSMKIATRCVQLGTGDDQYGAIVPPIYQTATFQQPAATEFGEYDYSRSGNPTRVLLEQQLADLEKGKHASAFASGMAAITALVRLVESGGEIIAGDDLYGGTVRLLERVATNQSITVHYCDTSDLNAVAALINQRTRLILIETPTNPLFHISDIRGLAQLAKERNCLLAVDNSMLSPVFQRPLSLGADVVIHSATKFLSGHSDVTAGALITTDEALHRRIAWQQNAEGAGLSPFESWLLLRGLKTLALRVERQNDSARKVASFLVAQAAVDRVYYPGLENHPGREIHRRQSKGDGAVVSFTTNDASFSARLVESTRLFKIAVSFGSVGSTISLPCRMSHASIPQSLKERLGPPGDLIRLSVGIEDVDDLIEDLARAFAVAESSRAEEQCALQVAI